MECRPGCGACCIAPSISSPLPGAPLGKPAGAICPHLDEAMQCRLFGDSRRPLVCGSLRPCEEMCGTNRAEALAYLAALERSTQPAGPAPRPERVPAFDPACAGALRFRNPCD